MAYCPLAQAGRLRQALFDNAQLLALARDKQISVAQLLLSWAIRHEGLIAIPKAGSVAHVQENAAALNITLSAEEIALLDQLFPAPQQRVPLDVV